MAKLIAEQIGWTKNAYNLLINLEKSMEIKLLNTECCFRRVCVFFDRCGISQKGQQSVSCKEVAAYYAECNHQREYNI